MPVKTFKSILLVDGVITDPSTNKPAENFIGIPVSVDCPFLELIFDPTTKVLAIVSKATKPQFQWVTRVDNNGSPVANKNKVTLPNQPHQQQRILMDTYHEHYIRNPKEIKEFLKEYAINPDYNFERFLK